MANKIRVRRPGTQQQAQAKMDIWSDFPAGRRKKAIGTRKSKRPVGGRGHILIRKSKTGYYTGGGF